MESWILNYLFLHSWLFLAVVYGLLTAFLGIQDATEIYGTRKEKSLFLPKNFREACTKTFSHKGLISKSIYKIQHHQNMFWLKMSIRFTLGSETISESLVQIYFALQGHSKLSLFLCSWPTQVFPACYGEGLHPKISSTTCLPHKAQTELVSLAFSS